MLFTMLIFHLLKISAMKFYIFEISVELRVESDKYIKTTPYKF